MRQNRRPTVHTTRQDMVRLKSQSLFRRAGSPLPAENGRRRAAFPTVERKRDGGIDHPETLKINEKELTLMAKIQMKTPLVEMDGD